MALPMLVNSADCGPINPLQGLSKQFDRDRGLQQDHFGAGRAGSSKEVFRTQHASAGGIDQDAARFFSANGAGPSASPAPYDLSLLRNALPASSSQVQVPLHSSPITMTPSATAEWASDFTQHTAGRDNQSTFSKAFLAQPQPMPTAMRHEVAGSQQASTWTPGLMNTLNTMSYQRPFNALAHTSIPVAQTPQHQLDATGWDSAFSTHEALAMTPEAILESATQEAQAPTKTQDPDELARVAGSLIDAVRNEQNPKFQQSAFLGLMKQLRDGEVTVEGDHMVPKEGVPTDGLNGWASEFRSSSDAKGKGKAIEHPSPAGAFGELGITPIVVRQSPVGGREMELGLTEEEEIDKYLREENDRYISYWNDSKPSMHPGVPAAFQSQVAEWDQLQQDWTRFEATATGLRPMSNYQFVQNNPYMYGEASTRQHSLHSYQPELSLYESVLQMEAAVQLDPTNAHAWYQLGVKQQENEREAKAIHALRRALELDPSHLPSWVALAISHTNEGSRNGAYEAIQEWVNHNERYKDTVDAYRLHFPQRDDMTQNERFEYLTNMLLTMSRSTGEEIDADIQIALAVLMNTNEAYDKAKDCFLTALAMRPDDWQLYNRVGATLANSGQPADALQYYYKALELNPSYIRARFNLGISCINLRRYEEASSHILDALALQETDAVRDNTGTDDKRGVTSTALWDSLKTCCLHLRRLDLATLCDRRDLEAFQLNYQLA
ncbi:TPR-like protein [Trametopsis cervina]|nr:TPR-like protein [Trametopsis cervina]